MHDQHMYLLWFGKLNVPQSHVVSFFADNIFWAIQGRQPRH
jgi:hypothetical protein